MSGPISQVNTAPLSSNVMLTNGGVAGVTAKLSKNNIGVYVGYPSGTAYDTSLTQYAATVGAAPAYVDVFIDQSQALTQWISGSTTEAARIHASIDGTSVTPVISVPLISSASNGLTEAQNFAAITSGADDSVWLGIVKGYQAQGYGAIDLRLGEEQNGNWYPWAISTPALAQAYVAAFDHISTLVHSVAGITVNVIWNPATVTSSAVPTATTYPGNAYVDIIGVDAYDSVYPLSLYDWSTHKVDATLAQWEANPLNLQHYWSYPDANQYYPTGTGQGFGLADAIALAKSTGKPLALAEAGAGGSSTSPSTDDALFPQYLATTLLASGVQIAFANIWDSGAYTFTNGSKPNEALAWANFVKEMNQGDAGPSAAAGSTSAGHGQTANLGSQIAALIVPGQPGDTETITAVKAALGSVALGSGGAITYTAPASGTDTLTYTVTDQLGDVATFTDTIAIDPGPSGGGGSVVAGYGQTVNLTSQLLALIKPGLAGDTETITAITSSLGTVTLGAGGVVSYAAAANGAGTLAYTVTDQLGDTASFTTAITVGTGGTAAVGTITGKVALATAGTGQALTPATGTVSGSVAYGSGGQAGVAIALLNTAGTAVATTTTGSTGAFTFASVPVGTYQAQYSAPAGEAPNATGPANTITGLTSAITVIAGQVLSLGTQTLIPAVGTVQGKVYHLGSADPSWGTAQSGVGVALVNAAGTTVANAVSNGPSGYFRFVNVADGTYHYVYTLPAGEAFQAGSAFSTSNGVSANFVITAGSSQFTPTLNVVSSSNIFALNGAGAVALRGDGNYTVTGTASGGTLTLGNGNDSVTLTGGGNTITVGAGNSTITALGANNLINVGPGMSFITADASVGNKFVTNAAGQGLETISGFTSGDILGLSKTLAGMQVNNDLSNLGSYITAVTTGSDTTLLVTPTGSGSASAFAQLSGVKTTVAALIGGHNLSLT